MKKPYLKAKTVSKQKGSFCRAKATVQHEMDYLIDDSVPLGFGMALAQNRDAVTAFGRMSKREREALIEKARHAESKDEMRMLVASIAKESQTQDTGGGFI